MRRRGLSGEGLSLAAHAVREGAQQKPEAPVGHLHPQEVLHRPRPGAQGARGSKGVGGVD